MSKFDAKYSEILNEANGFLTGLGKAAGYVNNAASAVGSGINAAQNPFGATKGIIQGLAGYGKKQDERSQAPIDIKNPVKKGEKVICSTSLYTIKTDTDPRDPKKTIEVWDVQQVNITGTALTDSNKVNGSFQVKLDPLNTEKLVFFRYSETTGGRNGQPFKSTSVIVVGVNGKIPAKYITPPAPLPTDTTMVGKQQNVDQSLQNWYIVSRNTPK